MSDDLDGLARDFSRVARELPHLIDEGDKGLAEDVATDARKRASGRGSTAAHAAGGVLFEGSAVVLDAASHPEILGAEFGGRGRPSTMQFPPFLGAEGGYFLRPAEVAATTDDRLERRYAAPIERALEGSA